MLSLAVEVAIGVLAALRGSAARRKGVSRIGLHLPQEVAGRSIGPDGACSRALHLLEGIHSHGKIEVNIVLGLIVNGAQRFLEFPFELTDKNLDTVDIGLVVENHREIGVVVDRVDIDVPLPWWNIAENSVSPTMFAMARVEAVFPATRAARETTSTRSRCP